MANGKKSFLLYCDLIHTFDELSDEEAGKLIKHILRYVNDKNPKTQDKITKIAFEPIKQALKRDLETYEKKRAQNSENAKIRWMPKDAVASDPMRTDAKHADSDIDSVSDNDIGILSEIEIGATIQFCSFSLNRDYDKIRVVELWQAFLINGQEKNYTGRAKKIKHFRNWIKTQPHETHKRTIPGGNGKLGTSEARIERAKNWPAR